MMTKREVNALFVNDGELIKRSGRRLSEDPTLQQLMETDPAGAVAQAIRLCKADDRRRRLLHGLEITGRGTLGGLVLLVGGSLVVAFHTLRFLLWCGLVFARPLVDLMCGLLALIGLAGAVVVYFVGEPRQWLIGVAFGIAGVAESALYDTVIRLLAPASYTGNESMHRNERC